jgi:hypothetical protein
MFLHHPAHQMDPSLKPPMMVFKVKHALVFNRFHSVTRVQGWWRGERSTPLDGSFVIVSELVGIH